MKKLCTSLLHRLKKSNDKRVSDTAINRERLIRFSHKLKNSYSEEIIFDYSVEDEKSEIQSSRLPLATTD